VDHEFWNSFNADTGRTDLRFHVLLTCMADDCSFNHAISEKDLK